MNAKNRYLSNFMDGISADPTFRSTGGARQCRWVRISIPAHLTVEKARALADAVHGALVSTCNIPANELFQLISRFSATNMLIDPTFPDVERSADASIVEVTLLTGRSDDRKRSLYRAIAAGAVAAGFRSDDVMVALIENGPIDWSLGRGEAYSG